MSQTPGRQEPEEPEWKSSVLDRKPPAPHQAHPEPSRSHLAPHQVYPAPERRRQAQARKQPAGQALRGRLFPVDPRTRAHAGGQIQAEAGANQAPAPRDLQAGAQRFPAEQVEARAPVGVRAPLGAGNQARAQARIGMPAPLRRPRGPTSLSPERGVCRRTGPPSRPMLG